MLTTSVLPPFGVLNSSWCQAENDDNGKDAGKSSVAFLMGKGREEVDEPDTEHLPESPAVDESQVY